MIDRKLNYEKVFANLIASLAEYVTKNKRGCMVLGISGGIDSTITSIICHEVAKITKIPLVGVSLMCNTNESDEVTTADLVGEEFCNEYYKENIEDLYKSVSSSLLGMSATSGKTDAISEGNIKARLRMISLWHISGLRNGVVMDTDNLTEHHLGFWTLFGDSNYITPIGDLWKSEVFGLGKYLLENRYPKSKSLAMSLDLTPTDGNGVKAGGDLAQIGAKSYYDVDDILYAWVSTIPSVKDEIAKSGFDDEVLNKTIFGIESKRKRKNREKICKEHGVEFQNTLGEKYGINVVKDVIKRSWFSQFKRHHLPLVIKVNGEIRDSE